jgi:hypothetical protein
MDLKMQPTVSPEAVSPGAACRFCGTALRNTFVDLGMSPLCQTHIEPHQLNHPEVFYPLHAYVCSSCLLVQLEQYATPQQIFGDYAYFSSYSDSWLEHARSYTASMVERLGLSRHSRVIEIASNDGYLLKYFVGRGIPCLGIEPAANVAKFAVEQGVPTMVRFFGRRTAEEIGRDWGRPDLLLGNNVLAHVPDLNDFVAGMKLLLSPTGAITMEFPHLLRLMQENQFDTIYHEHFSYFSFLVVQRVFAAHGLTLFDVDELQTHGGSLRIYARHSEAASPPVSDRVRELLERERALGLDREQAYADFDAKVRETKGKLLEFLIGAKRAGKRIAGYGAPGKGATLLNYCGIRADFLDYTVDRSPHKQGRYTPGTHIPICHPDRIRESRPDYVLILPWNLKTEIMEQISYIRAWGGRFVIPIPEVKVLD